MNKTRRRGTAAHGVVDAVATGEGRATEQGRIAPGGFAPRVTPAAQAWVVLPTRRRYRVVTVEVPITGLPPSLDGLCILHLSDLPDRPGALVASIRRSPLPTLLVGFALG